MVKGFGTRKLTDRLIIALAFSVLLVIILMIFHINMYIEMSKHVFVASRPEHNHEEKNVARCRADYRRYFQSISCVFNDKYLFRFILHELQQIDEQLKWKTQGY